MPADVSVDQMDDVMGVLGDEDIEIVDAATQVKIAPKRIVEEERRARRPSLPPAAKKTDDGLLLEVERPGSYVPPQDGQRLRCSRVRERSRSPSASSKAST